jgi:hypothetical protein
MTKGFIGQRFFGNKNLKRWLVNALQTQVSLSLICWQIGYKVLTSYRINCNLLKYDSVYFSITTILLQIS